MRRRKHDEEEQKSKDTAYSAMSQDSLECVRHLFVYCRNTRTQEGRMRFATYRTAAHDGLSHIDRTAYWSQPTTTTPHVRPRPHFDFQASPVLSTPTTLAAWPECRIKTRYSSVPGWRSAMSGCDEKCNVEGRLKAGAKWVEERWRRIWTHRKRRARSEQVFLARIQCVTTMECAATCEAKPMAPWPLFAHTANLACRYPSLEVISRRCRNYSLIEGVLKVRLKPWSPRPSSSNRNKLRRLLEEAAAPRQTRSQAPAKALPMPKTHTNRPLPKPRVYTEIPKTNPTASKITKKSAPKKSQRKAKSTDLDLGSTSPSPPVITPCWPSYIASGLGCEPYWASSPA